MNEWDIDTEGSTEIHPPKGVYLIEITDGEDTKKDASGNETPRKRDDGCPMILFKCGIVMDANGLKDWAKYNFNIVVSKDDRGMRTMRRMIQNLLPGTKGKMAFTPKSFNGKMAWIELDRRNDFISPNHESWEPKDARKVGTAAQTTVAAQGTPDNDPELPF